MSTAFYSHPECRLHDMGAGHPECPQRLDAIGDHLRATGLDIALDFHDAPVATLDQLSRAHASGYVAEVLDHMQRVRDEGEHYAVDPDTTVGTGTLQAALRSAGAAVAATDEVLSGRASNAFCAVRPPGHHATRDQAMGFCFFNNIAVAARHALDVHGLQRVAIVDFDVHHGNGTEDIIAGDERALRRQLGQRLLQRLQVLHRVGFRSPPARAGAPRRCAPARSGCSRLPGRRRCVPAHGVRPPP